MYDRLLVPIDGSGPATAALELAIKIASVSATVHLVYVDETIHITDETANERAAISERTDEEIFNAARELATDARVTVSSETQRGDPQERILEYAAIHDIEIIVMGSHGRRRIGRLALGNVTREVVRDASIPVLVVRASDDIKKIYPYNRILVPTDGSDHADVALNLGIETAAETGATLHLLSVVNVTRYGSDAETNQLIDPLKENARTALKTAAAKAVEEGVDILTAVTVGTVHREISAYTETKEIDLLVMGTHGRSVDRDRELIGSVTERVLRTASAPVLTVRAPEATGGTLE